MRKNFAAKEAGEALSSCSCKIAGKKDHIHDQFGAKKIRLQTVYFRKQNNVVGLVYQLYILCYR